MGEYGSMCPVFRPTREEFEQPFCDYMRKIFRKYPDLPMFKVVPPRGWRPRRSPFPDLRKVQINVPIRQHVFGTKGAYRCVFVEQKPMSVAEFKLAAEEETQRLGRGASGAAGGEGAAASGVRSSARTTSARHNRPPPEHESVPAVQRGSTAPEGDAVADGGAAGVDPDAIDTDMERAFWSNVTLNPPMYGADTPTSFFDEKLPYGWNLQHLGDLLQTNSKVDSVPGVTTPMTYFGMWRSFFGWHKEDADLYSINFLHWGAPKVWYGVPPSAKQKFERMAQSLFPELHRACPAFVRHKDIMLSPSCLKTYGVPHMRACQRANEFVVLNAAAYHAGFNSGFNCAEAVNFGMKEWIPVGKAAVPCRCQALRDGVRISMKLFDPKWVDPYETPSESSDSSEAESSDEEDEEEEEEEEQAAPAKRRRGQKTPAAAKKPRGGRTAAASAAAKKGRAAAATKKAAAMTKKAAGGKGRGRAAAAEETTSSDDTEAESSDGSEEEEEEEQEEQGTKAAEEEEHNASTKPKRKRTLTKKAAAAMEAAAAAAAPRARGRAAAKAAAAPAGGAHGKKTATVVAAAAVKKAIAKSRGATKAEPAAAKPTAAAAAKQQSKAATTKATAPKAVAAPATKRGPGRPRKADAAAAAETEAEAEAPPPAEAAAPARTSGRKRKAEPGPELAAAAGAPAVAAQPAPAAEPALAPVQVAAAATEGRGGRPRRAAAVAAAAVSAAAAAAAGARKRARANSVPAAAPDQAAPPAMPEAAAVAGAAAAPPPPEDEPAPRTRRGRALLRGVQAAGPSQDKAAKDGATAESAPDKAAGALEGGSRAADGPASTTPVTSGDAAPGPAAAVASAEPAPPAPPLPAPAAAAATESPPAEGRLVVTAVKQRSTVEAAAVALKARSNTQDDPELVVGPPMAIVGDAESPSGRRSAATAATTGAAVAAAAAAAALDHKRFFFLVQRLARPAPNPGNVLLRWLKEGRDGLFRPVAGSVWEEPAGALLPVRALAVGCCAGGAAAAAAAAAADGVDSEGDASGTGLSDGACSSSPSHSAADAGGPASAAAAAAAIPPPLDTARSYEAEAWRLLTPREQIIGVELKKD